ncbi:unnamed protein product [Triticum turgidum subsp. durum]|uniref:Glycosyltransferase n=1 Tax=Triticum turgidum subsp. durum TaxID=4567 RepID=A0A9R1Q597_TRITD|nr:unnamed protein product [Triticum turgidum subsp. durum]
MLAMDAKGSSPAMPPPPPLRIVICPWLAFGHLLPYLELAERLASRGHRVYYVSTPRNIARLPPLRTAAMPCVELVALPFPRVDGLPDGAESTNDVPADKRELHWKAFDGLAAPFAEFMAAACARQDSRPHWVIADGFHHWAAAAAVEHKVPFAQLLPTAAMMVSATSASTPRYEREGARFFTDIGASGMSCAQRCSLTGERSTLMAIRSCPEWEPECFQQVAAICGKPVVPLGLLPPSPDGGRRVASSANEMEKEATIGWLDAQPPKSVLYVALGSEVPLRTEQAHELALGLELAGARFLWALRKPLGAAGGALEALPPGFQERTSGHGLVTTGWVPQMSVLAHGAVGAFLTHCGRNSLIEGLLFGHPLVMLPILGDQWPNARLIMEARKVGLQVARDEKDGSFHRHGVASAVRAVMLEGEARRGFVANALKLQKIVADEELHERYIDELVKQLRSHSQHRVKPADPSVNFYKSV